MNMNQMKKQTTITLLCIGLMSGAITGKPAKKSGPHRSPSTTKERPNDNELMQKTINQLPDFTGKKLSALPIKDLIRVFEIYILNFVDNEDPFTWDLQRLSLFSRIFDHYSKSTPKIENELKEYQALYQKEFGITTVNQLGNSLKALSHASRSLYKTIDVNRTFVTLLQGITQFVKQLKQSLPQPFAQRIGHLEDKLKGKLRLSMIPRIKRRLQE